MANWPDQPPSARAHGRADRDLPLAPDRAREQQIRHVCAGDQQHQAYRSRQYPPAADRTFRVITSRMGSTTNVAPGGIGLTLGNLRRKASASRFNCGWIMPPVTPGLMRPATR
jgi:hypothetical protein